MNLKSLKKDYYTQATECTYVNTTNMIDVMGYLRRMRTAPVKTFGELCKNFLDMSQGLCSGSNRIDFVFDSYVKGSIKDNKRARRSCCKPIDLNVIAAETYLPVSMDAFWASPANKVKLQQLLRETILQQTNQKTVVVSALGVGP